MQMSRAKGRGRGAGAEPMMDEGQGVARSRTECIKEIHVLPVLTYVSCGSRTNSLMVTTRLLPTGDF